MSNFQLQSFFRRNILAFMMVILPSAMLAQDDPLSLEAMIDNHKTVRTVLDVRAIMELGVYEYHKESSKKITDYRKIEDQLDKYKRGFEILDLVLQGTATAFHGVNTYHSIKRNMEGYWKLVDTYHDKILSHGAVWSSDTLILNTSSRTVDEIKLETENLYKSYMDLSLILSGASECSTANLMKILNSINESMDQIDYAIYHAYLDIHTYMTIRLGYWKKEIFMARGIKEIVKDSYTRWLAAENEAHACIQEKKPFSHLPLGGGSLIGGRKD
mgnify:FL=1